MRPVRLIAFSVIVLVLAGGGYWLYKRNTDPRIVGIPLHENADGTIDYTLVDWGHDFRKTPTYWVLRFSKELHVLGVQDSGTSPIIVEGKEFTRKNREFGFVVTLPDYKPVPLDARYQKNWVGFHALSNGHVSEKEWTQREKRNINDHCKVVGEFAPQVSEYDGDDNGSLCKHLIRKKYPGREFVLRDGAGKLLGYISCSTRSGNCDAQIRLLDRRTALLSFDFQYLAKLPEIYSTLVGMVERATVRLDPLPPEYLH